MYLFYVDESGFTRGWAEHDNSLLAGIAVHEGQVRKLSLELDQVQSKFFPGIRLQVEIHASDIHGPRGARFRKMPLDERSALLDAAYNVITMAGFPNLIAFMTAIHVTAVDSPQQAFRDCLEDLCTRFNIFLVRQFKSGFPDKGLLIVDRSGRDQHIREVMAEFHRHGTKTGYLGNIIDVPYFAASSHTRMLQLADLLAYAGHRYFNRNDDRFLKKALPRIDRRSARGNMVGLKHIIAKEHSCSCIAIH